MWKLFEVYKEGDGAGRPFFFPKPLVHITEKFFQTEGHMDFLHHICDVAADKGNTYFVFDRGETAKISECCRLSFKLEKSDIDDAKTPWKMRYSALQNVTINLPRIAYEAAGDDTKLFQILRKRVRLAAQAHLQKKKFIERLLSFGNQGPLALLAMELDGNALPSGCTGSPTSSAWLRGSTRWWWSIWARSCTTPRRAMKFGLQGHSPR